MLTKGAETLPKDLASDYKGLAKLYDAKNYKKGLNKTQKILRVAPNHPETLAMKALFELGLGEEDVAEKDAKKALQNSRFQSMFCWHTVGTVLKQKRKFQQAVKAFKQALSYEKDNLQILRETATLSIQVRDHDGHAQSRWKILKLKSNMIYNWAAYAVSLHLKGDFESLYKALDSIENLRQSNEMKAVELSQYLIYRVICYRDGGKYEKMYDELVKNKSQILDEDIWNELMLHCCQKLNKQEQAQSCIEFLLKKYPQNTDYIKKYNKMFKGSTQELYSKLIGEFNSKMAKIYQIAEIKDVEEFRRMFSDFIKPYFQKNLISLFAEIQYIYENSSYADLIGEIFVQHEMSLRDGKYPDGTLSIFPTEYLWSLYLLAQHYSRSFSTLKQAHEMIIKAIAHTNTVSEFYMTKADIEYKMHNNLEALKTINEARKTDLADRYMNNICVKYLMRCRKPEKGEQILKLFMRDEASLYELQNQWYIIETAKAHLKLRNFEAGLRHLHFIEKQFQDIEANQYDFHTYCIRKWNIREYIEYIAFNDNLYQDKKYVEAATYGMNYFPEYVNYLAIKKREEEEAIEKPAEEGEDAKKTKKKKKNKNKNKNEAEEQELTPTEAFRKRIDYNGKQYAQKIKENPMNEAFTFAKNVASARYTNKNNVRENKLYCNAFAAAIRTFIYYNKPLLVIKSLKKLLKTNSDPFTELAMSVKSIVYLRSVLENEKSNEIVKQFVKEYLDELCGTLSAADYRLEKQKELPESLLKEIRNDEIELELTNIASRQNLIQLYKGKLNEIIGKNESSSSQLQKAFYLVNHLEFYGEFTQEMKDKLNAIFAERTTYFTDWFNEIDKLHQQTWSLIWLSDYDLKREEQMMKESKEKSKAEEAKTSQVKIEEEAKTQ